MSQSASFPNINFTGRLRPSQSEVVSIAQKQLDSGSRRLHVVAPPGSGKTVLGLYLWAEIIKRPCLVLSPNSAIQSQWAARVDLFESSLSNDELVSTDPLNPTWLTSLTYQSVTMPARGQVELEKQARQLWVEKLIDEEQVTNPEEAGVWINDLETNNAEYFSKQLGNYKKKIRDEASRSGDSISLLHPASQATLERLADMQIGAIILDECHHLLGHWGRVMSDALAVLGNPIVIGLTATPPDRDGKDERDVKRYDEFFGEVDFEVPVPAVVKDGFLAPYQDLAYFVRPTTKELKFIASADQQLEQLVDDICQPGFLVTNRNDSQPQERSKTSDETEDFNNETKQARETLEASSAIDWLTQTLGQHRLPTGTATDWNSFARRDPALSLAGRQFLTARQIKLPANVPALGPTELPAGVPSMEFVVPVIDRLVRHYLRRSACSQHQQIAKQLTASLRTLGVQITDTATRACVSPVGRVMAYSQNKSAVLLPILKHEFESLGDSIRAVVIADFERSSSVSAQLKDLMDSETGGAIAAFKTLLTDETTDLLEPILLTGSTILIDDEIEQAFLDASRSWLSDRGFKVELESETVGSFRKIKGSGADWAPRVYVEMVTELFQQGLSKCLIGTRGLLGEGWDANKINVLVDLTTVTTSMSINQLRGRSFRLDPSWQEKLANNWDVVCIAPEFSKGFDDYSRFKKKHKKLFGVSDDGAIEKGVGHVHPAFTEIKPEGLETNMSVINDEMLARSKRRARVRDLWKIGEPFNAQAVQAVEIKLPPEMAGGFPPFGKGPTWNDTTLTNAIGSAVLASLIELGKIRAALDVSVGELSGGYIRAFLTGGDETESRIFSDAMRQVLGPLDRPRYVVPRNVAQKSDTFLSRWLPEIVGKYFQKTESVFAMLHAVPSAVAKNKQEVAVFQKHWNALVSPGEAVFALRGEGEEMVNQAKQSLESQTIVHDKELFL